MKESKKYNVPLRRKREGKTNYKKRLRLLLSHKPRLVIRPSLRNMAVQIITYAPQGDSVVAAATARELEPLGWKGHKGNIPSAYLTGLLLGTKAKGKGVKEAILDLGLKSPTKGSRVFACLKGAIDAGLTIPHGEDIFPSPERIAGKDIAAYAELLKENKERFKQQFAAYLKAGVAPADIPEKFAELKKKIKVE